VEGCVLERVTQIEEDPAKYRKSFILKWHLQNRELYLIFDKESELESWLMAYENCVVSTIIFSTMRV
jgi:hypothetical protein